MTARALLGLFLVLAGCGLCSKPEPAPAPAYAPPPPPPPVVERRGG